MIMLKSNPEQAEDGGYRAIGNGKFHLIKKIGEGSFGKVYIATDAEDQSAEVAIKAESIQCRFPQLLMEFQHLKYLRGKGIPELRH